MSDFERVFRTPKPIIAMAHLPPLPGTPLYDHDRGIAGIVESVASDVTALEAGGVDAIMFGNEGDRPYTTHASPETLATMAVVVSDVRARLSVPFGVNYLWDAVASVALAHATGANFVREIFTGVYESDMGQWIPEGGTAVRLRANLRSQHLLLFNVNAEFASLMGSRTVVQRARSAAFAGLADGICVSGIMTGDAVEVSDLAAVKEALPNLPVIANTGVRLENVEEVLSVADAAVVGTSLKLDGNTWNAVDEDRVARFMERVAKIR